MTDDRDEDEEMPKIDEHGKYALDTMVEMSKQLIGLSTGIIVVTISFIRFILPEVGLNSSTSFFVIAAWILLIISIFCGFFSLGAIAATTNNEKVFDIKKGHSRKFLQAQQVLFILAFVLFVVFAAKSIHEEPNKQMQPTAESGG